VSRDSRAKATITALSHELAELKKTVDFGEQKLRQAYADLRKVEAENDKFRKEAFQLAEDNDILRKKVQGALLQLMDGDGWDEYDVDE